MARLIDSSVFIDLERRGGTIGDLDAILLGEPFALASITASELLVGVHRADAGRRRGRRLNFVEKVLSEVPVVIFDLVTARTHARIAADLAAAGLPNGSNDLLIAATAIARGYSVLTFNMREFQRVPGLVEDAPSW